MYLAAINAAVPRKVIIVGIRHGRQQLLERSRDPEDVLENLAVLGLRRTPVPCGARLQLLHDGRRNFANDELSHCYQ